MNRPLMLLLVALMALGLGACNLEKDDLDINFDREFDFEVPINADQLCPAGEDCSGMTVQTQQDRPLKPIEIDVDIDIVNETKDQVDTDLRKYTGKFKSVEIVGISYETAENTLSFDLPEMKIYMGTVAAKDTKDASAKELAVIPVIAKGWTGKANATINEANKVAISDLIKGLQFSFLAFAEPVIPKGSNFPPTGKTNIKFVMKVRLVANPADAITK